MADAENLYGYDTQDGFPNKSHAIPLTVFFALFTAAHIFQAGWKRQWWLYATTVVFGLMEVIGWAGRLTNLCHARI